MKKKKSDVSREKDLKYLIEDYLEQDFQYLEDLPRKRPDKASFVFSNIFQLLCDPDDNVNIDDLTTDELKRAILEWHPLLTPVWTKIKRAYLDYRNNTLMEREKYKKMIHAANDPVSPLSAFKEIVNNGDPLLLDEKTYDIKLRRSPITIKLSLDSDKFTISMEGNRVVDRFLLHLRNAPTDIFTVCDFCGKIVIITKKGKRYHSGCASKAKQRELWTKDPEGCREKEKKRYHQRVKGK